jgi:hypothetical protein
MDKARMKCYIISGSQTIEPDIAHYLQQVQPFRWFVLWTRLERNQMATMLFLLEL